MPIIFATDLLWYRTHIFIFLLFIAPRFKNVTSLAKNISKGHRNSTQQTWLTELWGRGKGASVGNVARWALFCYRFLFEGKALHIQATTRCGLCCLARQLASFDDFKPATVSAGEGVIIHRVQIVILEFKLTPGLRRCWTPACSAPGFCWPHTQAVSSGNLKFKTDLAEQVEKLFSILVNHKTYSEIKWTDLYSVCLWNSFSLLPFIITPLIQGMHHTVLSRCHSWMKWLL